MRDCKISGHGGECDPEGVAVGPLEMVVHVREAKEVAARRSHRRAHFQVGQVHLFVFAFGGLDRGLEYCQVVSVVAKAARSGSQADLVGRRRKPGVVYEWVGQIFQEEEPLDGWVDRPKRRFRRRRRFVHVARPQSHLAKRHLGNYGEIGSTDISFVDARQFEQRNRFNVRLHVLHAGPHALGNWSVFRTVLGHFRHEVAPRRLEPEQGVCFQVREQRCGQVALGHERGEAGVAVATACAAYPRVHWAVRRTADRPRPIVPASAAEPPTHKHRGVRTKRKGPDAL